MLFESGVSSGSYTLLILLYVFEDLPKSFHQLSIKNPNTHTQKKIPTHFPQTYSFLEVSSETPYNESIRPKPFVWL